MKGVVIEQQSSPNKKPNTTTTSNSNKENISDKATSYRTACVSVFVL